MSIYGRVSHPAFFLCLVLLLQLLFTGIGLYVLFNPINNKLSLIAGVFRIISTIIFGFAMVFVFIFPILFTNTFIFGQLFYALQMFLFGLLIIKSGYVPRLLGVLLIISAIFGYLMENFIHFFLPSTFVWLAYPGLIIAIIAECLLCIWLLLKGGRMNDSKN